MLQFVAVRGSALQCGIVCAVRCSVSQRVAVRCCVSQCVAVRRGASQCVAVRCSALQCIAVYYSVLQCVAVCCSALRDIAVDGSDPTKFSEVSVLQNFACAMTAELIFQNFNLTRTPLWWMHMALQCVAVRCSVL